MTTRQEGWERLCAEEPALHDLLAEIQAIDGTQFSHCANAVWYGYDDLRKGFKYRMSRLVGHERGEPDEIELDPDAEPDIVELGPSDEEMRAYEERIASLGWLGTSEAYDIAYETLFDHLPPCQHWGYPCSAGIKPEHEERVTDAPSREAAELRLMFEYVRENWEDVVELWCSDGVRYVELVRDLFGGDAGRLVPDWGAQRDPALRRLLARLPIEQRFAIEIVSRVWSGRHSDDTDDIPPLAYALKLSVGETEALIEQAKAALRQHRTSFLADLQTPAMNPPPPV